MGYTAYVSAEQTEAERTEPERPAPAPAPAASWKRHLRFRWSLLILFTIVVGATIGIRMRHEWRVKARRELDDAVENGDLETVKWCLDVDPTLVNHHFEWATPLHNACAAGDADMIGLLIDRGADINAVARIGVMPVHSAVMNCRPEAVKLLIDRGADIRAAMGASRRYLWSCNAGIVRLLIEAGVDADAADLGGQTWLHDVCSFGSTLDGVPAAKALIDAGANVNARDDSGSTPLHLLANCRFKPSRPAAWTELGELLLDSGADPVARDGEGVTPLQYARRWPKSPGLMWLLEGAIAERRAGD